MMKLDAICAGYGSRDYLKNVSAHFTRGRLTGLIGPNGSGKSTLIKVAAFQMKPSLGQVILDGAPLANPSPHAIAKRVAYMPQMRIAPAITVRQLVAHGRYPHLGFGRTLLKSDWEKVDQAMETARVSEFSPPPGKQSLRRTNASVHTSPCFFRRIPRFFFWMNRPRFWILATSLS